MRKTICIAIGICLVGVGFYFFQSSQPAGSQVNSPIKPADETGEAASSHANVKARPRPTKGDASEVTSAPLAPIKKIVHQPSDFTKGELENTIVTDGLQLGTNPTFLSRLKPYRFFGIYISPEEQAGTAFDRVTPNCDLLPANESEMTFEFRTKPVNADWTVWEEVAITNFNQPFMLEAPATSWQYRLTFYANDPANSPKVRNVSMISQEAQHDPAYSANNTN
jgi:hypothetical protein